MGGQRRGESTDLVIDGSRSYELRLLGGFEIRCDGHPVEAIHSCERLLAFLALSSRSLPRAYVAASLWPDTTDEKACANLRTALWRAHRPRSDVVTVNNAHLALSSNVWVDVRYVDSAARHHRNDGEVPSGDLLDLVRGELLPGFWDPWLVFERERLRQEMIHLFNALSRAALARHDDHVAVLAALRALECDPLHEPSTAQLITSYLAAGNYADARRTFRRYAERVGAELGVDPSPALREMVAPDVARR